MTDVLTTTEEPALLIADEPAVETEPSPDREAGDRPMPALYLGHGAPPLLDDPLWTSQLAAWARELPRPRAVLIVSAHWESAPLTLGATETGVPLTYDFYGFPERFYRMTYRSPGAPELAARVAALMPDTETVRAAPGLRARSRGLRAADGDVPAGRRAGAADLDADARPPTPLRPREATAAAPRGGRARHRLGIPHARAAVPERLPHRRDSARMVGRLRPVGQRGAE